MASAKKSPSANHSDEVAEALKLQARSLINPSSDELGILIACERHAQNMTQAALADKAGLTRAAIAQIETGRNYPKFDNLIAIYAALNVELPLRLGKVKNPLKAGLELLP